MLRRADIAAGMVVVGGASRTPDPAVTPELERLEKISAESLLQEVKTFYPAKDPALAG